MIIRVLGLVGAFLVVALIRQFFPDQAGGAGTAGMALGFVLITSFLLGQAAATVGLPQITGYILVGMAFGPYLLVWLHPMFAVLTRPTVEALQLIDAVALGLIALTAGGELKLDELRAQLGRISAVILGQGLLATCGTFLAVMAMAGTSSFLQALTPQQVLAAAILLGVTALANSPATALAIIQESRARGPMAELVLAVTVTKDVLVISLFTIALPVVGLILRPGSGFDLAVLGRIAWEVTGSMAAGLVLGWAVAQYLKWVGREAPLVVLAVAFCAVALLPNLHLSGVLACMVAGFYIENFSPHGDELIQAIERHALPVYVVFFTIAGAGLDLGALAATWPLALGLAGTRLVMTAVGTMLGTWVGGGSGAVVRYGWSGFIAQAGVTLGFALLIGERLPVIGAPVKTLLLATIALNQVVGPLLFRLGLFLAKEIPAEGDPQTRTK